MKNLTALIVDNDPRDRRECRAALEGIGFKCFELDDGKTAYEQLCANNYSVVVMDIDLPIMSGHDVIVKIRQTKPRLPIIAISAYGGVKGELAELNADADDFMHKPFTGEMLQARTRRLLRLVDRAGDAQELKCGDIRICTANGTVKRGKRKIVLTSIEYAVLECLVRNAGAFVSSSELHKAAWPTSSARPGAHCLHTMISKLRRKLTAGGEDDPIRTQWGTGYAIF